MLDTRSRIVLALAALLLVVMYFTPLWRIRLEAPQYPEGIGLKIMLSTVAGQKPNDLANINNLNHYIGMKRIVPEAIPELRIMPWAVGLLIVFGLAAAASGRAWVLYTWVGLFTVLAVAGLVDFWLWEYDYGHNLDMEKAIIKVPGMSYQPPLIGSKQLLNFKAHSWPGIGGWSAFVSLAAGFALVARRLLSGRRRRRTVIRPMGLAAASLAAMLVVSGCARVPEPFVFGEDQCAHCRMTITDPAYATQVVSTTGRAYKLDSAECLLRFLEAATVTADEIHSRWVSAVDTGELVRAESAWFVQSPSIRSPMGGGLAAFSTQDAAAGAADGNDGKLMDWEAFRSGAMTAATHRHHP
jgi:copper chaperone NosL